MYVMFEFILEIPNKEPLIWLISPFQFALPDHWDFYTKKRKHKKNDLYSIGEQLLNRKITKIDMANTFLSDPKSAFVAIFDEEIQV